MSVCICERMNVCMYVCICICLCLSIRDCVRSFVCAFVIQVKHHIVAGFLLKHWSF